jgi:hypothetical protein
MPTSSESLSPRATALALSTTLLVAFVLCEIVQAVAPAQLCTCGFRFLPLSPLGRRKPGWMDWRQT